MFCPKCKSEYEPGFTRCADCDVPLVDELPPEPAHERPAPPVVVFETYDASLFPVVESLLSAAGIQFSALGRFISGQLGAVNPVTGPVRFIVGASDARRARKLLARLRH